MAEPARPSRPRRRLYLRIYLVVLGIVAALLLGLSTLWHAHTDPSLYGRALGTLSAVLGRGLPPDLSAAEQQAELDRWADRLISDVALYAADGRLLGASGRRDRSPRFDSRISAAAPGHYVLGLTGGRVLLIHPRARGGFAAEPVELATILAAIAVMVALACYPLVRGLTRRLERLQRDVEQWSGTDHLPRATVQGRDEIAALAHSFNAAAQRIEDLLRAQKSLLANASHELRSPLARIRMAIELLPLESTPGLRREIVRNVRELDLLVDEVLLSSRLEALGDSAVRYEPVDLAELVQEIAGDADVTVEDTSAVVHGDARLLRRLVRNLVENAQRHGGGDAVEVVLRGRTDGIRMDICDRGPGIAEAECERVFEPFYRAAGASEADGGVGLGLSLVSQIARLHGGRVACRPRAGGGSCFEVWLPGQRRNG